MVSQYDAFISALTRQILVENQLLLKSCQRQLGVKELMSFDSLNDVIEFIIQQEIDELIRGSHSDQFDYFKKRFNIEWQRDALWQTFF